MRGSLSFADDNVSKSVFIVEGIALTVFGIAAIAWPGLTVYAFLVLFGLYALIAGIANVIGGILKINQGWQAVATIVVGGLLIAAGSYVLNRPALSAAALVILVAFAFLIRGIVDIVMAAGGGTPHKGLSVVAGMFGILVGLILLRHPIGGGLAYVWVLGIYALVSGPIMIAIGLGAKDSE